MDNLIKVALVDDHPLFRAGLRALLREQSDIVVAGEAGEAREAYRLVEATPLDVITLDIALPGVTGIATTRELIRRRVTARVLMLTMHSGEDFVAQALAAGAAGYALKTQMPAELVEAIHAVARGESYLCPRISRPVVDDMLRQRRGGHAGGGPCDMLSPREREVFDLLVRGYSNDDIAAQLCISIKTVETHRARILKKLRVHSMVELLRFASRHGLLYD
jgi:DNA-binding NarL/FixJ family response regulator